MSIRLKLLAGCLALTIVSILMGGLAMLSLQQSTALADQILHDGLVPFDRLHEARLRLVGLAVPPEPTGAGGESAPFTPARSVVDRLEEAMAILDEASALSKGFASGPAGESLGEARTHLQIILRSETVLSRRKFAAEIEAAARSIGAALDTLRGEAETLRVAIANNSRDNLVHMLQASGAAAVLSALITLLLSRSIVTPIHRAVRIAGSIADGRLDNAIDGRGRSETSALLRSLATMQANIAEQFTRIEQLRRKQATSYVETITVQNARFQAALDNMSQGLCLFDREHRLIVTNRRFDEMFGPREIGLSPEQVRQDAFLRLTVASSASSTFLETLADGRTIALSRRGVIGGGLVITMEDITERFREDEVMRHLARHDSLTDLPNRLQFREELEAALSAGGATMLGLDLDGFKTVNDTLGHPTGDKLLKAVAARLTDWIGADGSVARIGGDEFGVVLPALGEAEARARAQSLIRTVGEPFRIEGHEIAVGVSIGIASSLGGAEATPPDDIIKHADLALYCAKGEGKNTFRFFRREMSERLQRRREVETELRGAIERGGELELFYQPFVEAKSGRVSGFEALLRWRHPQGGMISPAEFVPIAEDVGLIHPIGLWVLEVACREAAAWPAGLHVSVNLSPVQFRSETLLDDVRRILEETGIDPGRVQLEVTESLMLENPDATLATLAAFRAMGLRLSMDDFGTGYSSLGYLTRYPFDKVKIDQSFVRDMHVPQNLAVIRSVIGLAEAIGMAAIAEGVETQAHFEALRREGCPEMQGYHFSRPVPADAIPGLILRNFSETVEREAPRPASAAARAVA